MATRRKRRRRQEELEEQEEREQPQEREREREVATEPTPADRVLELQKTAGNRAVGAAIARWGFPGTPTTAAPQWPKEPQVIADGLVLPLKAWSWVDRRPGTGGGSGRAQPAGEMSLSTTTGAHSSDLLLRTAEGRAFKTVVIVVPGKDGKGVTITLHDVSISGYQLSGELETWTVVFAGKEFSQSPPQAQPRP
jgi:hypothetical protein